MAGQDSGILGAAADQCYQTSRALAGGNDWVLEAWVYAKKANDPGIHTAVANGHGGVGFLLGQNGDKWSVFVGGVGPSTLGNVTPETWTHLAVVCSGGQTSGYVNGKKTARLPGLGGAAANFAVGATQPGKEPLSGWIAEVRYSTFAPGKFDPAADLLLDTKVLKQIQAGEMARRATLIESLATEQPGVCVVTSFDETPAKSDWLIKPPTTPATLQIVPGENKQTARLMLGNGLVNRTFLVSDNLACVSMRRSDKNIEFLRAVKPEVRFRVDGGGWVEVGGLTGAPEKAYLVEPWLAAMESKPGAFRFTGLSTGSPAAPYPWQPKCNAPETPWPPKGLRAVFHFAPPADARAPLNGLLVDVIYEIYEGLPVVMKTFAIHNKCGRAIVVDEINGEYLAVLQDKVPLLHCESDYSFGAANFHERGSSFLHFHGGTAGQYTRYYLGGGTTKWEIDPEYNSWATLNPAEDVFLGDPHHCLLVSRPAVGPELAVAAGGRFDAFRTFEILNDTTEKERRFLAQRRFYRKVAPQVQEHQVEVHAPTHNVRVLKELLDQMGELGFERLQIEHPHGIAYADLSAGNIKWLKEICDYARTRNVRVGGYELMMASRGRGAEVDCIDPNTGRPGSLFGQSACGASKWGDMYFANMWKLIEATGLGSFNPDGPYHGDPCASKAHHHRGIEDSQWMQWQFMCNILREGQRRNLYLTIPDYYFLNGQVCTGMGYREATDNIDIVLQTMIYRQYIFDGTFHKTAGMGWVNLNTEVLRGGLEANLDKYERQLFQMLGSGAQVWVRGCRVYDGPRSRAMVEKWMTWFKKYRPILTSDIIHVRRPDGRSLDYFLHVNPDLKEKGLLLAFNPTPVDVRTEITVPLYYTGLTDTARIRVEEGESRAYKLDRGYNVRIPVSVPAGSYSWLVIE
jgi:hypothetical protein